jgi:hypothetical protein
LWGILLRLRLVEIVDPIDFLPNKMFREAEFRDAIAKADWQKYQGKPVLIPGCSDVPIPAWAYLVLTARLVPVAKSISYGEVKRPIPVFGKLGEPTPA